MSFPNPWDSPEFFQRVKIGGRLVKANLTEIDGNKIEHEWAVQRPLGSSGATNVYMGAKPAGPAELTFVIAGDSIEQLREEWDDMRALFEMIGPKPGSSNSGQGNTTGSPGSAAYNKGYIHQSTNDNPAPTPTADDLLKQAQAALAQLQAGGPAAAAPTAAGPVASILSPGPKPPTLSFENGYFNYVGITAISIQSWDGPKPTATNAQIVKVSCVLQKAPVKAAVGAASTQTPNNPGQKSIAFGEIQGPQAAAILANDAAAKGGAGT
jgi:hypothetical protein